MIALRAPLCLDLGIVTALTAVPLLFTAPAGHLPASAPELTIEPAAEPMAIRSATKVCDHEHVTSVVIRGQFWSPQREDSYAISFAGSESQYTAFTDPGGYFEVRIPREDFIVDFCSLPSGWKRFGDDQMTLEYRIELE